MSSKEPRLLFPQTMLTWLFYPIAYNTIIPFKVLAQNQTLLCGTVVFRICFLLCGKRFHMDLFVAEVANPWSHTLMFLQVAIVNSNLWMLVEQLTHEGRSTSSGCQDEDVGSSTGVGQVGRCSREALVTRLIRDLWLHLAHLCRTLAAVVSVARRAKS